MNNIINLLFNDINNIIKKKKNTIIVIDGMACSGKTTLTRVISDNFDCRIIHMDDFFLPIELRTKDRLDTPGGNIHYERFLTEVISSLDNDIKYRRFNCSIMDYEEEIVLPYKPLTIIEGSYSSHPIFGKFYDYMIYTELNLDLQQNRILKRDGERLLQMFNEKWLKYESIYFNHYKIKDKANIVIKDMDVLNVR